MQPNFYLRTNGPKTNYIGKFGHRINIFNQILLKRVKTLMTLSNESTNSHPRSLCDLVPKCCNIFVVSTFCHTTHTVMSDVFRRNKLFCLRTSLTFVLQTWVCVSNLIKNLRCAFVMFETVYLGYDISNSYSRKHKSRKFLAESWFWTSWKQ